MEHNTEGAIVVEPGKAPPFPAHLDAEGGDEAAIATAAWAQSGGSIIAYEQLCHEHIVGDLDLLGADDEARLKRREARLERLAAEKRAEREKGTVASVGTVSNAGTAASAAAADAATAKTAAAAAEGTAEDAGGPARA